MTREADAPSPVRGNPLHGVRGSSLHGVRGNGIHGVRGNSLYGVRGNFLYGVRRANPRSDSASKRPSATAIGATRRQSSPSRCRMPL